eukprot:scaffold8575_cov49-Cylindrotheca_fusiformis.AAC.1
MAIPKIHTKMSETTDDDDDFFVFVDESSASSDFIFVLLLGVCVDAGDELFCVSLDLVMMRSSELSNYSLENLKNPGFEIQGYARPPAFSGNS